MEELQVGAGLYSAVDGVAPAHLPRVTGGGSDHAGAAAGCDRQGRGRGQVPPRTGQQHRRQLRPQQGHEGFAFGITEAAVELDHLGAAGGEHQSGIDHAAVVDAPAAQGRQGGLQHTAAHRLQARRIEQGRRGVGPHAAGVGAGVAFANALVVLGGRQQHQRAAISEGEHRHLRAAQRLLEHQRGPRRPEAAVEHLLDRRPCLLHIGRHGHPFAGGQSIGLHHQGPVEPLQNLQGLLAAGGAPVASGGDARFHHQGLGPLLAGLQPGAVGTGSEHRQPLAPQLIREARRQGGLGAHHHQLDRPLPAGGRKGLPVALGDRQHLAARQALRASVSRGDPHGLHAGAAGQAPAQGVLAAAAPHHQDPGRNGAGSRRSRGGGDRGAGGGIGWGHGWGKATGADPVGRCWAQSCQPAPPTRAPGHRRTGPLGWEGRCGRGIGVHRRPISVPHAAPALRASPTP